MKPDQSDTLAKAQARAAEAEDRYEDRKAQYDAKDWRRCVFRHDVLASHGFEIKAGFVCYGHSAEFDNAG